MNVLQKLRTYPLDKAMHYYVFKLKLAFLMATFQFADWHIAEQEQKCCFVRSRGGSKTNDFVNWLIFHVLRTNETWIWMACKSGQLQQAMSYVRQNPFVKKCHNLSGKYDVELWSGKIIRFGIISTSNLGLRVDGIVYDEFEDLQPNQEVDIYPQMAGMMTHSAIHKTIYLGTLWVAALLNTYAEQYPCSVRPWDEIPWLVKAGMIQEEIDQGITPQWEIDMMYRCIPTAPHGRVFPNLLVEDLSSMVGIRCNYGLDFGSTDHAVGIHLNGGDLYILEEREVQLEAHNDAFDFMDGFIVEAESGGYNDSDRYAAKCDLMKNRVGASGMPVTNKWKSERIMKARSYQIHVDKNLTPGIYTDLMKCIYGPDGLYLKDVVHPNHWTDAFLHAIGAMKNTIYNPMESTNYSRQRAKMNF